MEKNKWLQSKYNADRNTPQKLKIMPTVDLRCMWRFSDLSLAVFS